MEKRCQLKMEEKCRQCGRCCREWPLENGIYKTSDGIVLVITNRRCVFLTENNKCSLEDHKPDICRRYFCK